MALADKGHVRRATGSTQLVVDASITEVLQRSEGEWVTVGGIVSAVRLTVTSRGDRVTRITLADFHGSVDVLAFARTLDPMIVARDDILLVGGRVTHCRRGPMVVAQLVERFDWHSTASLSS